MSARVRRTITTRQGCQSVSASSVWLVAAHLLLPGLLHGVAGSTARAETATPALGIAASPAGNSPVVKVEAGYMVPYQFTLPGTEITVEMVPIPGGKFLIGSPEGQPHRRSDEGPQFEVEVEPFWMGKYEVTWGEYRQFMALADLFKAFSTNRMRPLTDDHLADAVTAPSNLYDPSFTFTNGQDPKLPAVTMSQHAAKQYTKWLSKMTGVNFRLPTEAEWEYACKAGTTTAYSFGDDGSQLPEFGWFFDNATDKTHPVGQKKPNPWGLYDMHGNVSEWVLDQYAPNAYAAHAGLTIPARDAIQWPTQLYPRVLRGGSWDSDAEDCRSTARQQSNDDAWKVIDPNLPKSPWWFTEGPSLGVGFRVMRPLRAASSAEQEKFWEADIESIRADESARLHQGRGSRGYVDTDLPAAIQQLRSSSP